MTGRLGQAIRLIEQFLAMLILIAITLFIIINLADLSLWELSSSGALVNVISDVLLLILGLEVVRLLVAPSVKATVELLIYVIARKALSPQATALDLLYNAIAFGIIVAITYLLVSEKIEEKLDFFQFGESRRNKE